MKNPAYNYVKSRRPDIYEKVCVLSGLPDYMHRAELGQDKVIPLCSQLEGGMMEIAATLLGYKPGDEA